MLTPCQIKALNGRLWPGACKAQGWPRDDRAFRLAKLGEILGRELKSSAAIEKVHEFTRVKDRLLMLADNLRAAAEDGDPVPNAIRTRRFRVAEAIRCVRLYADEAYVRTILRDRFHRGDVGAEVFADLPLAAIIEELDLKDLDDLLMTLSARLHGAVTGLRVRAGDTLHEMKMKAGLHCSCKDCSRPRITLPAGVPVAAPELEEEPF